MVITVKKIVSKSELISEIQKIRMTKATVYEGQDRRSLDQAIKQIPIGKRVMVIVWE